MKFMTILLYSKKNPPLFIMLPFQKPWLPVAWLLAQTGRLDLVWFAYPISEVISLILSIFFLRRTFRAAEARFANLNETP